MYTIEKQLVITNSMTVAQAEAYYGRKRTQDEFIPHWWGLPQNRAKSPQAIADYMKRAGKSVRWIVGWDDYQGRVRFIEFTPKGRVALTTQSANIFSDAVEVDPLITTDDPRAYELYKAIGWLKWRYDVEEAGKTTRTGLHKMYWATQCSLIDKDRVWREAEKWRKGVYNPAKPKPPVEGASVKYKRLAPNDKPRIYRFNRDASLHNFNHKRHADMESVLKFKKGDTIAIVGQAYNENVKSTYFMTAHSFGDKANPTQVPFTNGINKVNLDLVKTNNPPAVEPPVKPEPPKDVEPTVTRTERFEPALVVDIVKDTKLVNIPSGTVYKRDGKEFPFKPGGDPISVAELTEWSNGEKFYRTAYSVDKKRAIGYMYDALKAREVSPEPEQPEVPETPEPEIPPSEDSTEKRLSALEAIVNSILEFLARVFSGDILKNLINREK